MSRIVSQDTANYKDAPTEGIRRVLEVITGEKIPRGSILNTDKIGLLAFILLPQPVLMFALSVRLYPTLNDGSHECST